MGAVAGTVHSSGGKARAGAAPPGRRRPSPAAPPSAHAVLQVLGVITEDLADEAVSGQGIGTVVVVRTMHERKARMAAEADAFVALPGGFGTMEELLEMITWVQLGITVKPVGVLNVDGFFDPLLAFFDSAVASGFIRPESRRIVVAEAAPGALLDALAAWTPPQSVIETLRAKAPAVA